MGNLESLNIAFEALFSLGKTALAVALSIVS